MSRIPLLALPLAFVAAVPAQARTEFKRIFAPTDNIVGAPERPYRQSLCLNGRWQFQPVAVPARFARNTGTPPTLAAPNPNGWDQTPIKIPSPWNVNTWGNGRDVGAGTNRPYVPDSIYYPSYPASWEGAEMGWLRRSFTLPQNWNGKRVVLHFEAVAGDAQVLVNGKPIGGHFDSFLPFDLDITSALNRTGSNELLVGVRKSNLFDKITPDYPDHLRRTYPNGSNMDNLVGIWNDVWLVALPAVRADNAFLQSDVKTDTLRATLTLRNDTGTPQRVRVVAEIKAWGNDAGKDVLSAPEPKWHLGQTALSLPSQAVLVPAGKTVTLQLQTKVAGKLKLWSPTAPNLYGAIFSVTNSNGEKVDSKYTRFGWRQFSISGCDLQLNGQKIQLFGDLLHPFGPFIGSRRYAWAQLKAIKDAGGNMIRPHAQPHPPFFLDLADEMGMCVLDEAAVFGSSINQNLKEDVTWTRLNAHVDNLVLRDRNHASVFGWSVANEMFAPLSGANPEERVRETALLAALSLRPAKLDPTRDWVSIDGDQDLEGALPVWSRHYGIGVPTIPDINKPRMMGEHGGTYFSPPIYMQSLAGDQAYESVAGRNVGLGVDVYQTITQRAKPDLAVFSPSEVAWFGLEHLPYGFSATDRFPTKDDGVWFGPYIEGQPGIQIERLPPYVATFNPGFDPSLPFIRPLPMYDAWKDALAGKNAAKWTPPAPTPPRQQPAPTNAIKTVEFEFGGHDALPGTLTELGVPLSAGGAPSPLLIINGDDPVDVPSAAQMTLNQGGTVLIIARDKGTIFPFLKPLVGDLHLTKRSATSLLHGVPDPLVDGFSLQDLYFATENPIQRTSLVGSFVTNNQVLLHAPKTDWSLFERQPESAKESSMIMYEHLNKGEGASLVQKTFPNGGKLLITTLDPTSGGPKSRIFWSQLLRNMGVNLSSAWLVSPGRDEDVSWHYTLDEPAQNWSAPDFDDATWKTALAPFGGDVPDGKPKTQWNSNDIWMRCTFDVKELPKHLRLTVHHDEDIEVHLNGARIWGEGGFITSYKDIDLDPQALANLHIGSNVLAVHCHQTAGGQFLDIGLSPYAAKANAPTRGHDLLLDGPPQG